MESWQLELSHFHSKSGGNTIIPNWKPFRYLKFPKKSISYPGLGNHFFHMIDILQVILFQMQIRFEMRWSLVYFIKQNILKKNVTLKILMW